MNYFFIGVAIFLAVLDWIAVAREWKKLEYFAKPATMLALLTFVIQNGGLSGGMIWFTLGLIFSLAGDVFLMLPKEQFIAGLVSFLLAHVAYIVGLAPKLPRDLPSLLIATSLAIFIALAASQIYRRIAAGLQTSGKTSLRSPVLLYTIVISLMLFSAMLTLLGDRWSSIDALTVCAGAALFFLSDAILAWNKFVSPIRYGRLMNMASYHLGQLLIALGAALHFLG